MAESVKNFSIKAQSGSQLVKSLSGGNQQKIVISKWLSTRPKILFLDEPTRGIDIGAKREIYALIAGLAERGAGVIVISSELEEVVGLCRRVLVLREGRIIGELAGAEVSEAAILNLCFVA